MRTSAPTQPNAPPPKPFSVPAIHELIIQSGKIEFADELRRLQLSGTIQADERAAASQSDAFHVKAQGTINQEPFSMNVTGGALLAVDPDHPYPFSLSITAGRNEIDASGKVLKPFDLGQLELQAAVQGRGPRRALLSHPTGVAQFPAVFGPSDARARG